jgi:hypothetical protein
MSTPPANSRLTDAHHRYLDGAYFEEVFWLDAQHPVLRAFAQQSQFTQLTLRGMFDS